MKINFLMKRSNFSLRNKSKELPSMFETIHIREVFVTNAVFRSQPAQSMIILGIGLGNLLSN